ncbi:MAG TPA: hypothetical protein VH583_07880 [Vicinamibacterales bacterium]|jgi:hypothetical protein
MFARRLLTIAAAVCAAAAVVHGFDTKWHADATRVAMERNGFSADARLLCQFENYLTDYFSGLEFESVYDHLPADAPKPKGNATGLRDMDMAALARMHFDALTTPEQVEHQWKTLESNTVGALNKWAADPSVKAAYRPVVLMTVLGASLHAVQDFYSHSNWLKRIAANKAAGNLQAGEGGTAPIWFDVAETDRKTLGVKTGWYPDGNTPNVLYHREENKDSTGRPLNAEAFDAATRASVDWVRRIMDETPQVPWATLKAWRAQPANLNGTWLRNADATFVTTTSTIAGHWDGKTPVKNVFAPEAARNTFMAGEALQLSLGVYTRNIAISHDNATPTPHWVGFTIYHVEKDLAKGLYLHGVTKN